MSFYKHEVVHMYLNLDRAGQAEGPPEVISKKPRSYTGKFLNSLLSDN